MFLWFFGLPRLLASSLHCIGWGHLLLCIQLGRNNWVASFNICPDWSWHGLSLQKGTFPCWPRAPREQRGGSCQSSRVRPRTGIAVISTTFYWSEQVNKISLDSGERKEMLPLDRWMSGICEQVDGNWWRPSLETVSHSFVLS